MLTDVLVIGDVCWSENREPSLVIGFYPCGTAVLENGELISGTVNVIGHYDEETDKLTMFD